MGLTIGGGRARGAKGISSEEFNEFKEAELIRVQQEIDRQTNTALAISNTEEAIGRADTAAQKANNAKGWTPLTEFEEVDEETLVKKITGYFGGTGTAPTLNVGKYIKVGGVTTVVSEAANFKGGGNIDISDKADKTYVDEKVKTDVPTGAKFTDTVYTHPTKHPSSIITQTATARFVTDTQIDSWDNKETPTGAQTKATKALTDATAYVDGKVLTDVPSNAKFTDTVYSHPTNHPATIITETTTKRFVTDAEKTEWSDKETPSGAQTKATKSLTDAKAYVDGKIKINVQNLIPTTGEINLNSGSIFHINEPEDTSFSITNAKVGAHSFTLIITMGETAGVLTFPDEVKWQNEEALVTESSKIYVLTFLSIDQGSTWLAIEKGVFNI